MNPGCQEVLIYLSNFLFLSGVLEWINIPPFLLFIRAVILSVFLSTTAVALRFIMFDFVFVLKTRGLAYLYSLLEMFATKAPAYSIFVELNFLVLYENIGYLFQNYFSFFSGCVCL